MPTFDYQCVKCGHITDDLRPAEDRQLPMACKSCGGQAVVIYSPFGIGRSAVSGATPTVPEVGTDSEPAIQTAEGPIVMNGITLRGKPGHLDIRTNESVEITGCTFDDVSVSLRPSPAPKKPPRKQGP